MFIQIQMANKYIQLWVNDTTVSLAVKAREIRGNLLRISTEYRPRRSRRRTGTPWHRWPAEASRWRPRRRGAARGTCNCSAISAHFGRCLAALVGLRRARPPRSPPETSRNAPGSRPYWCGSRARTAGDHLSAIAVGRPPVVIFADSSRVAGR